MAAANLTAARLRELLSYDPETGVFTRRTTRRNSPGYRAGDKTGSINKSQGYFQVWCDGTYYRGHCLAWLYMTGEWPADQIDHIDRVRSNNRFSNLRQATNALNRQNRVLQSNNTSGMSGVGWSRGKKMWRARIVLDRKETHIGYFKSREQAIEARRLKAIEMHPFYVPS